MDGLGEAGSGRPAGVAEHALAGVEAAAVPVGVSVVLALSHQVELVRGLRVLEGRTEKSEKSCRYGLWKNVLRELVLQCEPNDFEAAVLAEVAWDVPALLARSVKPAPRLRSACIPADER